MSAKNYTAILLSVCCLLAGVLMAINSFSPKTSWMLPISVVFLVAGFVYLSIAVSIDKAKA